MLERYERCLSIRSILDSSVPDKSEVAAWSEDPPCQEESNRLDYFPSLVVSKKKKKKRLKNQTL